MTRFALIAFALVLAGCTEPVPEPEQDTPPNVVVIFVDDLGYGDLSAYGQTAYQTPHLDQMAAEGSRFTQFYVSQPVCSASRAALLTGTYSNRIGFHGALGPGTRHGLHDDELTMAELFKREGYGTAIFGKWHLGHLPPFLPTEHGFDTFYGIPYSNDMWPYHPENPEAWGDLPTIEDTTIVGYNTDQTRFTTDFTNRAVSFMEEKAAQDQPFFAYLAHPMPHVPLFVSEERAEASGAGLYGDVIAEIDWSAGQVLETIKRLGLDDNTLVIFTSDNGPWLSYGNHSGVTGGLREGKGTTWEGGVRVPFIARWPGVIPAGRTVDTPAMTIDVLPAMAELLDAPLPNHRIDGRSMWPLLTGTSEASPQDTYFFYYHTNELQSMRSGPWKLYFPHRYRTMQGQANGLDGMPGKYTHLTTDTELYNLADDPFETTDVADQHPDVIARLSVLADSMRADLSDRLTGVAGTGHREPGRIESAP
ncbi:MAG: sulfatase [Rhodothermales bacterium]